MPADSSAERMSLEALRLVHIRIATKHVGRIPRMGPESTHTTPTYGRA
jgi:hypothetical protein